MQIQCDRLPMPILCIILFLLYSVVIDCFNPICVDLRWLLQYIIYGDVSDTKLNESDSNAELKHRLFTMTASP